MIEGAEKKLKGIGRGTRIDNKATVIGNEDGTPFIIEGKRVWIAVLDAAYRGVGAYESLQEEPSAFEICRALSLDGTPCGLPTPSALLRIWQHRDFIDSMDPTAGANTAKKLSNWGFDSASGGNVWSSSEFNINYAISVYSSGNVKYFNKNAQFGVVPVLEIPATEAGKNESAERRIEDLETRLRACEDKVMELCAGQQAAAQKIKKKLEVHGCALVSLHRLLTKMVLNGDLNEIRAGLVGGVINDSEEMGRRYERLRQDFVALKRDVDRVIFDNEWRKLNINDKE